VAGPDGECAACRARHLARDRAAGGRDAGQAPPIVHDVVSRAGAPIAPDVRAVAEQRFRHDFADVRIHSDAEAGRSAEAVGARAYTVGPHIVFGSGRYSPETGSGRQLLWHELTHVVQQASAAPRGARAPIPIADTENAEHEARSLAAGSATPAGGAGAVADAEGSVPLIGGSAPGRVTEARPSTPGAEGERLQRLDAHGVEQHQRSPGGAAVGRLVTVPRQSVQRYEAGEHAQFGGGFNVEFGEMKKKLGAKAPTITEGDIIALGDFYEDPKELFAAPPEELAKLVELVHRDRDFYQSGKGKAVTDEEWEGATAGRKKGKHYIDLAAKNVTHFDAPRSETGFEAGEDNNREKWFKHFKEALQLAQKKQMGQALVTNAFADHFLTDAFSAGHLINKAETVQKAHGTDTDKKRMDDDATREAFEKRIARGILADPRGKVLYGYQSRTSAWNVVFGGGWNDMNEDSLAGVVDMIRYHDEGTFYSMFVKAVHDRLNQDIVKGSGGIRVKNAVGDEWKLSGDKTLKSSPDTLKYGKKAVDKARQAVQDAEGKDKVDYVALAKTVWDIVPVPTGAGDLQITAAETALLDPKQQSAADAWIAVALENVPLLIEKLTAKDILRKKPVSLPSPAPAPGISPPPLAVPPRR
jgi:hypothetical protein